MNDDNTTVGCCGIPGLPEPRFFKALGDQTRVGIFAHLMQCDGPVSVGQIAGHFPVDTSVVSRHLTLLKDAGIVSGHRQGKEVLYSVNRKKLAELLRALATIIEGCCAPGEP